MWTSALTVPYSVGIRFGVAVGRLESSLTHLESDLLQIELQNSPEFLNQDYNSLWPEI